MTLLGVQAGDVKYVLTPTDQVIYLSDNTLAGVGAGWVALKSNDEGGSDYVVPADKVFTITLMQFFSSSNTGYLDLKYDSSAGSSGGTRFAFPQNILSGSTQTRICKIDIPAGNYINVQNSVATVNLLIIGVEHDA